MSILELEEPFKSKWKKAYLIKNTGEGRYYVHFYNSNNDRKCISYARYLYGVKIGFEVPDDIEIDHKDEDKTNDVIENLNPMTKGMHRSKSAIEASIAKEERLLCPACGNWFTRTERYIRFKTSRGQAVFYCSKACALKEQKASGGMLDRSIPQEQINAIKKLRGAGKSSYQISAELGVARNTVMKYW